MFISWAVYFMGCFKKKILYNTTAIKILCHHLRPHNADMQGLGGKMAKSKVAKIKSDQILSLYDYI